MHSQRSFVPPVTIEPAVFGRLSSAEKISNATDILADAERAVRSIVLNEPVSPPPADISQLTLDAWSAVERARDAALMLVCPGR